MSGPFDTDFDARPPKFTPEQAEALLKGEAIHVNGVPFTLAHHGKGKARQYGPPSASAAAAFAAYTADPATWKAAAAKVAKKMGKPPSELEQDLGYDVLDQLISALK